ncbi:MAG TPA: OPT/YSL family transporter, partial [bacterium]|nr:OPT/YSL family transporter [bacterium]
MHGTGNNAHLPENAFRKLKPGEVYQPIVPASSNMPQWTFRAVLLGIITAVIFSAAAAFLGFKVGQVIEAAIPIAIIAVGVGSVYRRRASLLENVIVQSVGAASGLIVAGAIFVLPALFILELPVDKFIAFMASLLGGVLGVLLLIPLRRYFVKEMHGEYPFPEATATTEILVAGESVGTQAKILMTAAVVGGIYDFLQLHAKAFSETITTYTIPYVNT